MRKTFLFGEFLLRLSPPAHEVLMQADVLEMHWAGSEANIGVSLSVLGDDAVYITALPDNMLAKTGISHLHRCGLKTAVHWKNGRVGTLYYESGSGARAGKVLYDRDHSSFSALKPGEIPWKEILEDGGWFHWSGITPAINENLVEICHEALQAAREKGMVISADFNYRSSLWNYGKSSAEVMPHLLQNCDVLLADVDTARSYFSIKPDEKDIVRSTLKLLSERNSSVKFIALTMRMQKTASENEYRGYLWHERQIVCSQAYQVNTIIERMGTGDAFMAGLIYCIKNDKPVQETINFATACGVMKHTIKGDFNLANKESIELLIDQAGNGKIIR